jgi:hypothetical protein
MIVHCPHPPVSKFRANRAKPVETGWSPLRQSASVPSGDFAAIDGDCSITGEIAA